MSPPRIALDEHGNGRRCRLPQDDPRFCKCDLCRADHNARQLEYYHRTVEDVRAGRRPAPKWLLTRIERQHRRNRAERVINQPGRREANDRMERAIRSIQELPELCYTDVIIVPHRADNMNRLRATIQIEVEIHG